MSRAVRRTSPGRRAADDAIRRLVASANEAAEVLGRTADATVAADRVAGHLRRQWRREMRERLKAHVAAGGRGLSELALKASLRL